MGFLTKFSLKNPVAVFILAFLLIIGGLYSFTNLKVDLLPDIEFPQISVEVVYPGASPQDVNEQVTSKLEDKFESIEGVKKVQTSSFESIAILNLEFPFNTDMEDVEQQLNTYIKEASLPESVSTKVNRFSFGSFPIFNISLFPKGDTDLEAIVEEEIVPELNKIQGINSVSVGGAKEELVQISVDKDKANRYGLSLDQVKKQINDKFLSFPAGSITEDSIQVPVRVEEDIDSLDALKNLPLTVNPIASAPQQNSGNGSPQGGPPASAPDVSTQQAAPSVTLNDIAEIEPISDQPEFTRYNLKDSLSMAITKKQNANTVEVADKTLEILNDYQDKIDYAIGFDSAEGIKKSVETLVREGLLGALFASVAVLLFLRNFRATIIAIISIPLSLLVSVIFLNQLDITLNIMTLGGMAVAVGRVVDDSIVVIENIFRRVRKADSQINDEIVKQSTKEILKAITSSTITTVVVFLPLGLVGGVTGEFFLPFALTIVFALLTSLIVAITIVPILAKFSFKKVPKESKESSLQRWYGSVIEKSLKHKLLVMILSFLLLAGSFAIVPTLGFTFLPNEDQKTLVASIELPSSTTIEKTNDVSLKIEEMLLDKDSIKEVTTGVGSRDFRTGLKRENQANYFINLKDGVNVEKAIEAIESDMEDIADNYAEGATLGVQELQTGGPPTNNNVNIDLYSTDLDALQDAADRVEDYMQKQGDLKYVSNNLSEKQTQWIVDINPEKAAELGVSGFQILGTVSDQTKPVTVGPLVLGEQEQTIELTYDEDLQSLGELKNTKVFTKQGPVNLSELAEVKQVENVTAIQKLDGKIFARVSAQINSDNIREVSTNVINGVKDDVDLPDNVSLEGGGGSDETLKTFQDLGLAMLVAIGLVYLTMLITFGKARIPFVILSSLIFVPIGSLVGLYLADEPLSVSAMIGLLMLIGIVTTNAIVLVDRIGQNREEKGLTIRESLIEAGKTRLRPILMTAFATIAALIPLALTTSSGTLISKGLAIVVIGGLTSSTLLTLIIVPVIYELFFIRQVRKEQQSI
ncbi:efflux RND transporter permease subunit [Pseudalkalibacillus caeni]|uniref:Efflux RND transporter permease subunit n=1 Tax=Exobacillus caeni TaxID=2574798 RepID=A0A5R9F2F0_9BACL|nr:efflux RND transporter permease subunit [Pseudalkalibacillus caeni]TLS35678.1 efflux RND transporter permease subunit [Pseudalkalibacillus caeni]